jgi:hypothetical protein
VRRCGEARRRPSRLACFAACLSACLVAAPLFAGEATDPAAVAAVSPAPRIGDCVVFREGGAGWLLKTPVYWLRGSIAEIKRERRTLARCPQIGRLPSAYTRADWALLARAMPCAENDGQTGEVEVTRVLVAVEEWETPWSSQHGTARWLFRGQFLDQTLTKGAMIDMDAGWLARCAEGE